MNNNTYKQFRCLNTLGVCYFSSRPSSCSYYIFLIWLQFRSNWNTFWGRFALILRNVQHICLKMSQKYGKITFYGGIILCPQPIISQWVGPNHLVILMCEHVHFVLNVYTVISKWFVGWIIVRRKYNNKFLFNSFEAKNIDEMFVMFVTLFRKTKIFHLWLELCSYIFFYNKIFTSA